MVELQSYEKQKLQEKLPYHPWYVLKYIDEFELDRSPASLLGYVNDFEAFFQWLLMEGFHDGPGFKKLSLSVLENLKTEDISNYRKYLIIAKSNSEVTVNRKLSALKSLFKYLYHQESDNGSTLLSRNVFTMVRIKSTKKGPEERAADLLGKVMLDEEKHDQFRDFIASDYGNLKLTTKQRNAYEKNKERDLAIISLILGSGLRVSEVASLTLDDIILKENIVLVIRKGRKQKVPVRFSDMAKIALEQYLEIRLDRYNAGKEKHLFLTLHLENFGTPMNKSTIQKMVDRYAKAFNMPRMSVHKLRHSFASVYHQKNQNVLALQRQLGHKSSSTTEIYNIISDEEMLENLRKMDR
ncbi:tyrosine recombinase XerS [Ammoniphilus resinae]|uniref:Site-specific recombinase XerD n=1 Tax=Ammoniphilus resinae TaxID=861532 RepID=A0ABS4GNZ7_9BACL|nr:tyrosine recombinase XerS [Ammoniphilus resinae]MBP1931951.1 site-specific recombinase XerD [Ammoniphilus resinae]